MACPYTYYQGDSLDYRDLARAGAELAVTVGIIEAAVDQSAPEEVKGSLEEKVEGVVHQLENIRDEFMYFGEAYDSD